MDIYKCYAASNCRCKKNYGYCTLNHKPLCLKCGTYFSEIVQSKKIASFHRLAIINKYQPSIYTASIGGGCEHNLGLLINKDDEIAICIECGDFSYPSTIIDKELTEFILNVL